MALQLRQGAPAEEHPLRGSVQHLGQWHSFLLRSPWQRAEAEALSERKSGSAKNNPQPSLAHKRLQSSGARSCPAELSAVAPGKLLGSASKPFQQLGSTVGDTSCATASFSFCVPLRPSGSERATNNPSAEIVFPELQWQQQGEGRRAQPPASLHKVLLTEGSANQNSFPEPLNLPKSSQE